MTELNKKLDSNEAKCASLIWLNHAITALLILQIVFRELLKHISIVHIIFKAPYEVVLGISFHFKCHIHKKRVFLHINNELLTAKNSSVE